MHFEPVLDSSELPGQTMRLTVGKSFHIHIVQMSTAGKQKMENKMLLDQCESGAFQRCSFFSLGNFSC